MNGKCHRRMYQSSSCVRVKYLLKLFFCLLQNISHAVKLLLSQQGHLQALCSGSADSCMGFCYTHASSDNDYTFDKRQKITI